MLLVKRNGKPYVGNKIVHYRVERVLVYDSTSMIALGFSDLEKSISSCEL